MLAKNRHIKFIHVQRRLDSSMYLMREDHCEALTEEVSHWMLDFQFDDWPLHVQPQIFVPAFDTCQQAQTCRYPLSWYCCHEQRPSTLHKKCALLYLLSLGENSQSSIALVNYKGWPLSYSSEDMLLKTGGGFSARWQQRLSNINLDKR